MKLFLGVFLALLLLPSAAYAGMCDLNGKLLTKELQAKSKSIETLSPPRDRSREADLAPSMKRSEVRTMLSAVWRAFGYKGRPLRQRVNLNLEQISFDSAMKPHLKGLFPGQVVIANASDALVPGGLFAFPNNKSYLRWKNYGSWRGETSRHNPLSNIVAAVAAQVAGKQVFAGEKRIRLPGRNKCS